MQRLSSRLIRLALQYGVIGLGFGTFLESLGIPFASIALPVAAGSLIRSGRTTFLTALIVSTTGLVLGSVASYYIGYYGGDAVRKRVRKPRSRFMRMFEHSLDSYGPLLVAVAQLYGPARTWISIPAGAAKMDIVVFVIATAIGGLVYCAIAISFSLVLTSLIKDIIKYVLSFANIYIALGISLFVITVAIIVRNIMRRNKSEVLK